MAFIESFYLSRRTYIALGICSALFFISYFVPILYLPIKVLTITVLVLLSADIAVLHFYLGSLQGERGLGARWSLGDANTINISLHNHFGFGLKGYFIDELPVQFQNRTFQLPFQINAHASAQIHYKLTPLSRGEFHFGKLYFFGCSPIGLAMRRFVIANEDLVKVYPSYVQLKKFQLLFTNEHNPNIPGIKKIRQLGHSLEFEKIKNYVTGDDVRTINWNATARANQLMVNMYTDARQQQIYCLIDKGRNMKMPFQGMTLLDHAINASLALLHTALLKNDKAGLITYSKTISDIIPADKKNNQLHRIIETLYNQQTDFLESDYEQVWATISRKLTNRGLFVCFTNFESMSSFERQLPFLKQLAARHLTCLVFFQNTQLKSLHEQLPNTIEGIYIKTIADQFALEKKQMMMELRKIGIITLLTTPEKLSVDVVNKYLELKARQMV